MGEVRVVKLITGEDIVAEVDGFNVKNPLRVLVMPEEGKLILMPWLGFIDADNVTLKDEHIMYITEPSSDIRNAYSQKFGGILTNPNKLVVPGLN